MFVVLQREVPIPDNTGSVSTLRRCRCHSPAGLFLIEAIEPSSEGIPVPRIPNSTRFILRTRMNRGYSALYRRAGPGKRSRSAGHSVSDVDHGDDIDVVPVDELGDE